MANEPTQMADMAAIPSLESLLKPIKSLEVIVQGWDESHRMTVQALRGAIDDLHKEALARLIRKIQAEPGGLEALKQVIADDVVYAVLRHLQLIRPSLNERIEGALDSVRPLILTHGGNVELVKIEPPDTVAIRLTGTCDGCPSSELNYDRRNRKSHSAALSGDRYDQKGERACTKCRSGPHAGGVGQPLRNEQRCRVAAGGRVDGNT